MKTVKQSMLLLLLVCCQLSVYSQTTGLSTSTVIYPQNTITLDYEKFDIKPFLSKFSSTGSLDYVYTDHAGTNIRVTCQKRGMSIEVYETPPLPYLHRIFKEFYPNGTLKQKGVYLPQQFRVGNWLECDERGNCYIVSYDSGRGPFGYNDVLKLLEEKGYINLRSGGGAYMIATFWYTASSHQWGVKLSQNQTRYKNLTIDAGTGEIKKEFDYAVSTPPAVIDRTTNIYEGLQ